MSTRYCTRCGTELSGSPFCGECGAKSAPPEPVPATVSAMQRQNPKLLMVLIGLGAFILGAALGLTSTEPPDVCLEALNNADKTIELAADSIGYMSEAMQASARLDNDELASLLGQFENAKGQMPGVIGPYRTNAEKCRESG